MEKNDCTGKGEIKRRTYSRFRDIPSELTERLNRGEIETATLTEQAAMDFAVLLGSLTGWQGDVASLAQEAAQQNFSGHGLVKRMALAGQMLGRCGAFADREALRQLMVHPADTVRGFACYTIAAHPELEFGEKFDWMKPLAADPHFGVREWAWLALRPTVVAAHLDAIVLLRRWVNEPDANLRRFAIEITRPRGVWAKHIQALQAEPWHGLPLLDSCARDESRYVQNSVANWLNDAARSQPEWVKEVCRDWLGIYPDNNACCYITKRAQRNLSMTVVLPKKVRW